MEPVDGASLGAPDALLHFSTTYASSTAEEGLRLLGVCRIGSRAWPTPTLAAAASGGHGRRVLGMDLVASDQSPASDDRSTSHLVSVDRASADARLSVLSGKVLLWYYYRRGRGGSEGSRRTEPQCLLGIRNRRTPE